MTISAAASNGITGEFSFQAYEKFVETVDISEDTMSIYLGRTEDIPVLVSPEDAIYPDLSWTSSDPTLLSVSDDGTVGALGCGTVTVTATSTNGIGDSIMVNISEVVTEKLEIQGTNGVYINDNVSLGVVFYPSDTANRNVEWFSSDEAIAKVDANGNISALQVGTAIITVTQKEIESSFVLQIKPRAVEQIISSPGTTLRTGESLLLSAKVYPEDATYPEITWMTSDPNIAVIDENGVVAAKQVGTVTITACSEDGYMENIELRVEMRTGTLALLLGGGAVIGIGGLTTINQKRRKR